MGEIVFWGATGQAKVLHEALHGSGITCDWSNVGRDMRPYNVAVT